MLPDPYAGTNSKLYDWVDEKVWYYRKKFMLDTADFNGNAFLSFGGVAYYCRVWVNGHLLGNREGMFGGPVCEICEYLNLNGEKYRSEATANLCFKNGPWLRDGISSAKRETLEAVALEDGIIEITNISEIAAYPVTAEAENPDCRFFDKCVKLQQDYLTIILFCIGELQPVRVVTSSSAVYVFPAGILYTTSVL